MILVSNGCSITMGAELQDENRDCYGGVLSRKLNMDFINLAYSGVSNQRIYRTTIEWILKNEIPYDELFIVIGWSDNSRHELYIVDRNMLPVKDNYNLNVDNYFPISLYMMKSMKGSRLEYWPKKSQKLMKRYFYWHYTFLSDESSDELESLLCKIKLQNFLEVNNIKYLMCDIFSKHDTDEDNSMLYRELNIIKEEQMFDYIKDYEISERFHPLEEAQKVWADYLFDYMEKHDTLG